MDNMDMLRLEVGSKLAEIEDLLKDWNLPTVTGVTLVARDPDNPTSLHVVLTNGGDAEIDGAIELLRASRNGHTAAAPGEAELVSFAQSAIEEVSDSWMYRATLHAQWACFYCNTVVEWVGDDGDEAVCEHFPGCLHLRARALRDNDGAD